MEMSRRDRRALILGAGALAVLGLYMYVVEPLWNRYDTLVARHEANASRVARILVNERKAAHYAKQVADLEEKTGPLSLPKPYSEQVTAISGKIVGAAQESGVQLKGSSPTSPVAWPEESSLRMATVVIEANAGWESVFKFVAALYRIEGVLSVEQVELTGKGGDFALKLTVSFLAQASQQDGNSWSSRS
jgi:hypothetical protein